MAYQIGSIPRDSFLATLQNEVTLSAEQVAALRSELLTDPAGRGYVGKNDKRAHQLFVEAYSTSNPITQPPLIPIDPAQYDRLQQYIADQFADGKISQQRFEKYCYHTDPNWAPNIPQPARTDVVLGGLIPTVQEVRQARQ